MSENPFEAPGAFESGPPLPGQPETTRRYEGTLTTISIILLVLGCLGLFQFCISVVGLGAQSFAISTMPNLQDNPQMEFQRENLETQQQMIVPTVVLVALNLLVSSFMTIGATGALMRKKSLRNLFRWSLYAAVFYDLVSIGLSIYAAYAQMAMFRRMVDRPEFANQPGLDSTFLTMMSWFSIGGVVINGAFLAGLMVFYIWSARFLDRPEVRQLFR